MRALLWLCDRYFLLTEIIGRSDMLWHGDPGESVPVGNVWLYERCREVEGAPDGQRVGGSASALASQRCRYAVGCAGSRAVSLSSGSVGKIETLGRSCRL